MATGQAVERDTSSEIAIFGRLIRADETDLAAASWLVTS